MAQYLAKDRQNKKTVTFFAEKKTKPELSQIYARVIQNTKLK